MHTLPLTHAGGSGVVYGDAIAYRRTAGEQEGECEGEDPFHFVSALSAALCDIFNFVNTIELCHFEVSNKGPAGNILQVSALINRHEIQPHAIDMIFLKRVIVLRNANALLRS